MIHGPTKGVWPTSSRRAAYGQVVTNWVRFTQTETDYLEQSNGTIGGVLSSDMSRSRS